MKSHQKAIRNKVILEEISRQVTVWIDTVLDESECKLLEENLLDLEEEEGPVLDLIDDLVDEVLITCVPPIVEPEEKISEDDLSSHLSKNKSTEELSNNTTEININELIVDIYTNVLEDAEQQILENHDYLLSGEIANDEQSVDLLSIRSDSDHVLDNVRGELNKLVDQIIDNLIADSTFKNETYIADEEAIETISQLEENTNNKLQVTEDSGSQENNVNGDEDLNITEQSEISDVDMEDKGDDRIINELDHETIENDVDKGDDPKINELQNELIKNEGIIKQIINDLLNTGVFGSEPSILDDNYTKPNDTEVAKQESLGIENQLNNEKEDLQNEAVVNDNESKQERQDFTQIEDEEYEENGDLSLSDKINEGELIVQDLLLTILENFALESTLDERETNEENKKTLV
ncbi:PREDICTED: protein PFC0760c-like isoform X2 [Papilio polytes]|uniref:protein PFC0760c-like isoform X2 n=1 Tax=Papilio polytes TaxID=76194 RepID=UPI0006764E72|nr:PREDICTED: protein PFC0760c-like isoform X2 [Papilio polytes]